MGITFFLLIVVIFLVIMLIVGGIMLVKKRWKRGLALISLPVLAGGLVAITYFYFFQPTDADSLKLSVKNKPNDTYELSGKWQERMDYYSYGTDFVAICSKDNIHAEMIDYQKGDWKPNEYRWGEDIPTEISKNFSLPEGCVPQLFDIHVQKEFSMTFHVKEPRSLYYVHIKIDPMSSPSYWIKQVQF
ncbi:hypothetical protein [Neobacillus sp. D3-1R]|uniref:hypothetical protein n=1 Tax=Neobacillus sp. D3-1R TaxID=3445778 RepID=UPI003F9FB9C9